MGDLSALVPSDSLTVKAIYEYHKRRGDSEPARGYLGASIAGHECDRYLWLKFRVAGTSNHDGRLYRLFETGNLAEPRFIKELEAIGCSVMPVDPNTGQQWSVSAVGGHFSGHMDGVATGIPEAPLTHHLLEFKTHSAKSFEKLVREGVKVSKPMHYVQCMIYMGLSGLTRALYLAVNKDTDELYSERIRYDATDFKRLMARAERIITSVNPCPRMTDRPDFWQCKFCDAHAVCWGTAAAAVTLPRKSCRTCCHATPAMDGEARWTCAMNCHDNVQQDYPCTFHLLLPGMIQFAEPVDAGANHIDFKNTVGGAVWRHGNDDTDGNWSTEELMRTPAALVNGPSTAVKKALCGTATGFDVPLLSLIDRYDSGDSKLLWDGPADGAIEARLLNLLGVAELPEPTETTEDVDHLCYEYDKRMLLVIYRHHETAAIWGGVE